eukprot:3638953-Amphidinium_carterae.1
MTSCGSEHARRFVKSYLSDKQLSLEKCLLPQGSEFALLSPLRVRILVNDKHQQQRQQAVES